MKKSIRGKKYQVVGNGPEFGVRLTKGGIVYDLLESKQLAEDIAEVLNKGTREEWKFVEPEVEKLEALRRAECSHA